ncbi:MULTISPECIES: ATP-binding cassette domain-containing protein [unclassified Corynebacterium]|uniref:ABC transporter ATP-binding protein n=1 Tax=unclassified Corynebacterium TaxID=2624378 RepID=UPI0029C9E09C|nr:MULTISPECIES: ATP-binding cassette domain-containing protein [unclassified Corynebacterium]WPF66567.1 ATP-binding cassette domain-containing protein [Corynebacterium sp. 22KM0430]WPF69056.1 ATP-binding cassette domain-containing protein [Corynebacterium sp. 21KM1197]
MTLRVNCTYGHTAALGSMSRDFPPGMVAAVAGPNGCGKSTLLATIAGEIAPVEGEVTVDGTPTRAGTTGTLLIAEPVFLPDLTVGEHLDLLRVNRDEVVEAWALHNLLQAPQWVLSSGQRQRAYLGMQLALEAPIMLIDEPERHLDEQWTDFLIFQLHEAAARGISIVVATHSARVISGCDEVVRLGER